MDNPQIINRHDNFLEFSSLNGKRYLYENVFGTIHNYDQPDLIIKDRLLQHKKTNCFGFDTESVSKRLGQLDAIVLNCTESCNLDCGYCIFSGNYSSEREHNNNNRLSEQVAFKALDVFLSSSTNSPYVLFYGGEPLLEMGLIKQVLKYVKSKPKINPSFGMTTNFTLARPHLDFIAENNFLLTISLDGSKEIHDKWRITKKGFGTYETITETLSQLFERYPDYFHLRIALSVTLAEPHKIKELRDYFASDRLLGSLPIRLQGVERNCLSNSSEAAKQFNTENLKLAETAFWDLARDYCNSIINGNMPSFFDKALFDLPLYRAYSRKVGSIIGEVYPQGMCIPGARKLFVNSQGEFYMCEKVGGRLTLGNINDGICKDAIENVLDEFCSIRNSLCRGCWLSRECPSCAASAKSADGISKSGLANNCHRMEQQMLTGLAIYTTIMNSDSAKSKLENYFKDYDQIYGGKNGIGNIPAK